MPGLSYLNIALRSVRFYWRTEVSVFLGSMVAVAALVGGLLVGDSVTYSLRRFALMGLGQTREAINAQDRYFDTALADKMAAQGRTVVAPILMLRGVVLHETENGAVSRVNHVQVIGVDSRFWRLAPDAACQLDHEAVGLNRKLAARLGIGVGTEISIRVGKPGLMPRDAPLASRRESLSRRGRFTVRHVVSDEQLGRFSMAAEQVAPYNVFVDLSWLQETMELGDRANALLVGPPADASEGVGAGMSLARAWTMEDSGLILRRHGETVQLESDRIFLDPAVSSAALSVEQALDTDAIGVLTYLVNGIRKGDRATPYSFAVAAGASSEDSLGPVPPEMKDDQAIINQWVADELDARVGDAITVSYYELSASGDFAERTRSFTVFRIASMTELERERECMPIFPGLTDVEQCREWDVGMPMDEAALEDVANQQYWDAYRATPKLVVTLAAGRAMWANRFGDTSAVRYSVRAGQVELRRALNETLNPGLLGLFVVPVREQALRAVADGMDLGQLFVSMSFFLIVAALLLTAMLFVFGVQQRGQEMGVLLGLGHRPWQVRRLFLSEGLVVALAGSIAGGFLGTGYTRVLVWSLGRYWHAAVGGTAIQYHAEPMTLVKGTLIGLACAWIAMAIAMRRQSRRPARELLAGDLEQERSVAARSAAIRRTLWRSLAALVAAGCVLGFGGAAGEENAAYVFFGAGFLLLLSVLGFARLFLGCLDRWGRMSLAAMGARNASRRGGRSLASVALLACGCFIVFGVSAMQQDLAASAHERWSGTGGFALFGETTLVVPDALESEKGRDAFGLAREAVLADASIVSLKVRDGDDASCFNLNRAQAPRLLGVDPEACSNRDAFARRGDADRGPWSLLEMKLPDGVIPGLAGDANTAMWNLRKAVGPEKGDEIVYRDERGEMFRVKLVGALPMPVSIFQGSVLIARSDFSQRYPSEAGYRMFVVDLPQGTDPAVVRTALLQRLDRMGLDIVDTLTRLEEFHGVEATYLGMFLLLGGLGVVLGTVGLGIVLSRNMLERRSELAMLRCVGFTRGRILWLVLAEHWMLLVLGIVCGVAAALVAIYPALYAPGVQVPVRTILSLLGGILLAGIGSTTLAVRFSLKGNVLPALRSE